MKKLFEQTPLFIMIALTLGLAPFFPEPHVWGKLKWIIGGANGMQTKDWLDFLMHGTPWILLILSLILKLKSIKKGQ
jgi:hypothetical protein